MIAISVLVAVALPFQQASVKSGHYAVSNFHIEVDGASGGYLNSVVGGGPGYETVEEIGSDGTLRKRPGRAKYGNIVMRAGTGMGKPVSNWIQASFDKQYARKNGTISTPDLSQQKTTNRLQFSNALVTEVTLPALDAASKEGAFVKFSVEPETARVTTKEPAKLEFPNITLWRESDYEVVFPDFPDLVAVGVSPVVTKFQWDRQSETFVKAQMENVTFTLAPGLSSVVDPFFQEVLKGSTRRTSVIIRYLLPDATIELTLMGACIASLNPERDASFADTPRATLEFMVEDFRYKVDHK